MPFFDLKHNNDKQKEGNQTSTVNDNNSQGDNSSQQQTSSQNFTETSGPDFVQQPQSQGEQQSQPTVPQPNFQQQPNLGGMDANNNNNEVDLFNNSNVPNLDLMFDGASPQNQTQGNPPQAVNNQNSNNAGTTPAISTNASSLEHKLSPNNTNVDAYLQLTEQKNASDLHFTVGYPPMLRVDDQLQTVGTDPLTEERAKVLFQEIISKDQYEKYLKEKELDFSFSSKAGNRFRVNYYWDRGYMAAAFRLIPGKIRTVEELGLPSILYDFAKYPHGLILLTGPTGSGKSTTIAAMLNEINMNQSRHIITVEDPIEYIYPKGKALINQREIERDTLSWTRALKYVLRQDPDVVLVGEMRDYETIASAITVSETGHLVFATLHTNSAAQTIDRIIDVFPAHQQAQIRSQLASVIVAVISQRLIPLSRGGRKAAVEILMGTSAVKNAIRENKTYQIDNIIQTSAEVGMVPLEKSLAEMVKSGEITLDTALEYTSKPDQLKDLLR